MSHPARTAWLAVLSATALGVAAWLIVSPQTQRPRASALLAPVMPAAAHAPAPSNPAPSNPALPAHNAAPESPVLSARTRAECPRAASACADLAAHVTWLQSGGRITYGPVWMEPGRGSDPTPRGTFHVAWKAGRHYISTAYDVPIPYAVFFAAGGVAFHAGSLTASSHGCIHLTLAAARYYNHHLPVGAEVAVF